MGLRRSLVLTGAGVFVLVLGFASPASADDGDRGGSRDRSEAVSAARESIADITSRHAAARDDSTPEAPAEEASAPEAPAEVATVDEPTAAVNANVDAIIADAQARVNATLAGINAHAPEVVVPDVVVPDVVVPNPTPVVVVPTPVVVMPDVVVETPAPPTEEVTETPPTPVQAEATIPIINEEVTTYPAEPVLPEGNFSNTTTQGIPGIVTVTQTSEGFQDETISVSVQSTSVSVLGGLVEYNSTQTQFVDPDTQVVTLISNTSLVFTIPDPPAVAAAPTETIV
ncbi:MAG TPA: hypothetical protein VNA13_04650 [Xanthomonadales bacterium]|nr:hypothetical protein [Xanthomonadales bacterium]